MMQMIVLSEKTTIHIDDFLKSAEKLGLITQWAYCFHPAKNNGGVDHWHVYVMTKDKLSHDLISSAFE